MIGKEKRIAPKCKTLQCPNWPPYLEATRALRDAYLRCGPIAFKCRTLQPPWQPRTWETRGRQGDLLQLQRQDGKFPSFTDGNVVLLRHH